MYAFNPDTLDVPDREARRTNQQYTAGQQDGMEYLMWQDYTTSRTSDPILITSPPNTYNHSDWDHTASIPYASPYRHPPEAGFTLRNNPIFDPSNSHTASGSQSSQHQPLSQPNYSSRHYLVPPSSCAETTHILPWDAKLGGVLYTPPEPRYTGWTSPEGTTNTAIPTANPQVFGTPYNVLSTPTNPHQFLGLPTPPLTGSRPISVPHAPGPRSAQYLSKSDGSPRPAISGHARHTSDPLIKQYPERPFQCKACSIRFTYSKDLRRHYTTRSHRETAAAMGLETMELEHDDRDPPAQYFCPERQCRFNHDPIHRLDNFNRHMRTHKNHG